MAFDASMRVRTSENPRNGTPPDCYLIIFFIFVCSLIVYRRIRQSRPTLFIVTTGEH